MPNVRAFSYIFVIYLIFQVISAKPMLSLLWCTLICDDESTTPGYYDVACGCDPPRPNRRGDINIAMPPSPNGYNMTLSKKAGLWRMNMLPWTTPLPPVVQPIIQPVMQPTLPPLPTMTIVG